MICVFSVMIKESGLQIANGKILLCLKALCTKSNKILHKKKKNFFNFLSQIDTNLLSQPL